MLYQKPCYNEPCYKEIEVYWELINSNFYRENTVAMIQLHLKYYPYLTIQSILNWKCTLLLSCPLILNMLGKKFHQITLSNIHFYFIQKIGFDVSCKLSLKATICMKCLILLSGKKKKKIRNEPSICYLLNLPLAC